MSYIVKGAKMPTCCYECEMVSVGVDMYYCTAPGQNRKGYEFGTEMEIPKTCPLIPLPSEHGELIDRDALLSDDEIVQILTIDTQRTGKTIKEFTELFANKVNRQPVIVPAERSE